jgi:hypothetical protein
MVTMETVGKIPGHVVDRMDDIFELAERDGKPHSEKQQRPLLVGKLTPSGADADYVDAAFRAGRSIVLVAPTHAELFDYAERLHVPGIARGEQVRPKEDEAGDRADLVIVEMEPDGEFNRFASYRANAPDSLPIDVNSRNRSQ